MREFYVQLFNTALIFLGAMFVGGTIYRIGRNHGRAAEAERISKLMSEDIRKSRKL